MKLAGPLSCIVAAILWACGGQIGPTAQLGAPGGSSAEAGSAANASYESIWREQKLVRNGEIEIEVDDLDASAARVGEISASHDGIVAGSQTSRYASGQRYASIQVRVPAAEFEPTLADLRKLGTVSEEGMTTEDVTKAYYDLETRLSVKRQTAARLRELLDTRTGSLADVIAAETELGRVTGEIEQMEGEKRFYDHRVATSTIEVSLLEREGFVSSVTAPIRSAFDHMGEAFGHSVQAIVLMATALLPWAVIGLAGYWIVRRFKKRRA
jgi:hypothetical protein